MNKKTPFFDAIYFKPHSRINPQTGRLSIYYWLVENIQKEKFIYYADFEKLFLFLSRFVSIDILGGMSLQGVLPLTRQ